MPNGATCPKALCGRAATHKRTCGPYQQAGDQTDFLSAGRSSPHTPCVQRRASCGFCKKRDALHVTPLIAIKYQMLLSFGYGWPVTTAFGRDRPPFLFFVASKRSSPSRSPAFWGAAIGTARWYNTAVFVRVTPCQVACGPVPCFSGPAHHAGTSFEDLAIASSGLAVFSSPHWTTGPVTFFL